MARGWGPAPGTAPVVAGGAERDMRPCAGKGGCGMGAVSRVCSGTATPEPGSALRTAQPRDRCTGHGEGIDSPPPGSCFPVAVKHALSLIKRSNQSTSYRRKGNSWANLTGVGWEVLLDTVFELRLLLDSSPVAISRIHNLQLLFIYFECCCRERSNLKKEVVEGGGTSPVGSAPAAAPVCLRR